MLLMIGFEVLEISFTDFSLILKFAYSVRYCMWVPVHDNSLEPVCSYFIHFVFIHFDYHYHLYVNVEPYYYVLLALQVVLNRPRTLGLRKAGRYRSLAQEKVSLKGWVERSQKEGKRKRLWACIGSSSLYFYKDEEEKVYVYTISI